MESIRGTENEEDEIKCPDSVPEEQKGTTDEERKWTAKSPPRPEVPRAVFIAAACVLIAAFAAGGWWYYRTNVLPEKYYHKAAELFEAQEYAAAGELYRKIMDIRPERRDLLYHIAYCMEMTEDAASAVEYYERHLESAPGDAKAMTRLAWLYFRGEKYDAALKWFKEAAKQAKDGSEAWRLTACAAEKAGNKEEAAAAWLKAAESSEDPSEMMQYAKALMKLGAYETAAKAYTAAAKASPGDKAPIHGLNAAKAMLGLPTDPRCIIYPGRALGYVRLGAEKTEVKAWMGGSSPEEKKFGTIGGGALRRSRHVEIWVYNKNDAEREIKIIFIDGKVVAVETSSRRYKTPDGLGLSNFMLAKNKGKLSGRTETGDGTLICQVKGGGLTFYAKGLDSSGTEAKISKLRVHRGTAAEDIPEELL